MILADEGLNGFIVKALREEGFQLYWILEINSGIEDEKVIELAKANQQILITEDKDFGEWVFAHKIDGLTIVFLRYTKADLEQIIASLILIISELKDESQHQFITITKNKIRKRFI